MPNSPNKPDPDSSNKPDPDPSSKPNNISLSNLFSNITNFPIDDLINNTFFAHFFSGHPFIANSLIFLIILLSGGNLYQIIISNKVSDLKFQNQVCQNNKELIEERVKIDEDSSKAKISPQVIADTNSDMNLLPFHCEYSIQLGNQTYSQQIYLRQSPVFGEYINQPYNGNGNKMNMADVCKHPSIKMQMIEYAKKNNSYYDEKKRDIIIPRNPELLKLKISAYPVHRWVCHYSIQRQGNAVQPAPGGKETNDFAIDLNLKDYCLKKSTDENTKFSEPHYHDYDNPYSFYCTDPYSRSDSP